MVFLDGYILGVRLFIWVYFLVSIILGVGIVLYTNRELLKEKWYKWRFPEKVIKIIMHYPTGIYRVYWRLIPDTDFFTFDGKTYNYTDTSIISENDFFVYKKEGETVARVEGKEYKLEDDLKIRRKKAEFSEIHYFYNVPLPIDYKTVSTELKLTSTQLTDLKENDLLKKLLTMEAEKNLLMFVLIIAGLNLLTTLFLLAKIMGWLSK